MRHYWQPLVVVFAVFMTVPAWAEQEAVRWHNDLESAKTVARESRRLVLIHFWTPSCGPCKALDQNVFSQAGVGAALEQQFVPVKLNADENPATAQLFGITRVPTDVVITPDGQVVGKLVSPPTPTAYIAEVTGLAAKHATNSGQLYAGVAAAAPMPSRLNNAYSRLQIPAATPPAIASQVADPNQDRNPFAAISSGMPAAANPPLVGSLSPNFQTIPTQTTPLKPTFTQATPGMVPAMPVSQSIPTQSAVTPHTVYNPAAMAGQPAGLAQQPITPIGMPTGPMRTMQTAVLPAQVANPYLGATAAYPAMQTAPISPPSAPAPTTPFAATPSAQYRPTAGAVPPMTAPGAMPAGPGAPATVASSTAVPDPRLLPPGAAPLAFDGYCPVTMRNSWKWVAGNPQYGIEHLGRTYWFAGPEEQKQFWTDPARYAPALSGNDPVLAIDHQQQVPGRREHSLDYDGLFYMFASEATLQQFTANPARYAASARQAMGLPRGRLVR
ncbi:MAG TPA: thioredoxin family protein [Lacipirellulaceae bacterium]|nr:thioredoxin family protein [Lacipirellulaceae bacterium]